MSNKAIPKSYKRLLIVGLFFTFFSCSDHSDNSGNTEDKPNIILCMSDDQGWGDIEYQDHPFIKTPNLNQMAAEGLRFDRFYAAAPVCSPTRASLLTGIHPNRMGCFSFGYPIKPEERTIAEILKKEGYKTAHFGKWHIGSIEKGSTVNPGNSGFDYWLTATNFFDLDPLLSRNGIIEKRKGEGSEVLVDEAIDFIKSAEKEGKAYFIVIWFSAPHTPHIPLKKDKYQYHQLSKNKQNFYAEISALDHAMGKLRKAVKKSNNSENTLIWFNGDNGGLREIGSTGGRGSKGSMYEGGLLVPGIVEWPKIITNARVTNVPSFTTDIFPTIMDICNISIDSSRNLDGMSLFPLFQSATYKEREKPMAFWKYSISGRPIPENEKMEVLFQLQNGEIEELPNSDDKKYRIRKPKKLDINSGHAVLLDWPFKLHKYRPPKGPVIYELYNLEKLKMEELNVFYLNKRKGRELLIKMEEWQNSVAKSYESNL